MTIRMCSAKTALAIAFLGYVSALPSCGKDDSQPLGAPSSGGAISPTIHETSESGGTTASGGSQNSAPQGGSSSIQLAGTGNSGGGPSCQGVEDTGTNTDCSSFGVGTVCDRTNSQSGDPRICTCKQGDDGSLNWSCNHLNGVAGTRAGNFNFGNFGQAGGFNFFGNFGQAGGFNFFGNFGNFGNFGQGGASGGSQSDGSGGAETGTASDQVGAGGSSS